MPFPTTPLDVRTELLLGSSWVDISDAVRLDERIVIGRGRSPNAARADHTHCQLTLKNVDGQFSPRTVGPYHGLLGRNTPIRVSVAGQLADAFGRTVSNGWGAADTGQVYTFSGSGGTVQASDFGVTSGEGWQDIPVANAVRLTYLAGESYGDIDITDDLRLAVSSPSGAGVSWARIFRGQSTSAYCMAKLSVQPGGFGTLELLDLDGSVVASDSSLGGLTNLHTSPLRMRTLVEGRTCRVRLWRASNTEPSTWHATGQLSKGLAPGGLGLRSSVATGNTDPKPLRFFFDNTSLRLPRFAGEVAEWPVEWDPSGLDVETSITAAGPLRRLGKSKTKLQSAPRRWIPTTANLVAYWPMEGGRLVESLASLKAGVPPLRAAEGVHPSGALVVQPVWGTGDLAPWLAPVVSRARTEGMTILWAKVPMAASTDRWVLDQIVRGDNLDAAIDVNPSYLGGSAGWPQLVFDPTANEIVLSLTGPEVTADFPKLFDGQVHHVRWSLTQSGPNVSYVVAVDGFTVLSGVKTMAFPVIQTLGLVASSGASFAQGHVAIWTVAPVSGEVSAAFGHRGESAGRRIERLFLEEGVPFRGEGDLDDTARVGPQRVATLLDNIQDAIEVDGGLLKESRAGLDLLYVPRTSLYHPPVGLALNYDTTKGLARMRPVDNDSRIRNDVTVSRRDGASAQVERETGPLSVQDPPDGVGRYDDSVNVNLYSDDETTDQAGWRVHLGTWDEEWFRALDLNYAAGAGLIPAGTGLDISGRITISNGPVWMPPGLVDQLADGYTETLGTSEWEQTFTTSPTGPWQVGVLDDDVLGKLDTDGSELAAAITASQTTFSVAVTDGPMWTTDDAEFPFDVNIGGIRMVCTDIAASLITFVAAGTAAHAVNASVTPALPAGIQAGDLLLVWVAIRNSGAGAPNAPTGYSLLLNHGNACLFGRIAGSSEAAPTITFSGGVASADTSAQMAAFRGLFHDVTKVVLRSAAAVNDSAQDVAYPGLTVDAANCLVLYLGWKQDDWTSVASPGTELGEPDTTTGDDHGLVWAYQIQTTPANIPAGSFTVTGGASAISRGAAVAIRCDKQTWTVTRGAAGVDKAHDAGTSVGLWSPLILAL